MTWDKKRIVNLLTELSERIPKINEEPLLTILKKDYEILLNALGAIDFERYYHFSRLICYNQDISNLYKPFLNSSLKATFENKDLLFKLIKASDEQNYLNSKVFIRRTIPESIYMEMVRVFFKNFIEDYYDLFLKLVDEKRIHFARNKQEIGRKKGACYYTYSNEVFLITDFIRRKTISTLPHEVAHAYEFSLITDFNQNINWYYSTFSECYPRFIQFAFLDFIITNYPNDKYRDFFLEKKHDIFDELKGGCEYYLRHFYSVESVDLERQCFICKEGKIISREAINLFITDFVAIHMFRLYKTNPEECSKFLQQFHMFKGIDDNLIWNMLDINQLLESFQIEANELNRELELSRTRKKSGTFQLF